MVAVHAPNVGLLSRIRASERLALALPLLQTSIVLALESFSSTAIADLKKRDRR